MHDTIGKWLSILSRKGQCFLERRLERLGIGRGQYFFLMALYGGDGISQDELTRRVFVDKTTTARAVQKLVDRGLVRCQSDINDGRVRRVHLTELAYTLKPEILNVLREWNSMLTTGIDEREQRELLRILHKMHESLSKNPYHQDREGTTANHE